MSDLVKLAFLTDQLIQVIAEGERSSRRPLFDRDLDETWLALLENEATVAVDHQLRKNEAAAKRRRDHTKRIGKGMR